MTNRVSPPQLSLRPTDFSLSHNLDPLFPEQVEALRNLQDAEKKLDIFTNRKLYDLQELNNQFIKKSAILRVFIYNTCENQPWQENYNENLPSTWTLRIEGRLIDEKINLENPQRLKFSDYLTGIAIDLDNNSKFEKLNDQINNNNNLHLNSNIIEWHTSSNNKINFDGMDIKRKGSEKVNCQITIQPKDYPNKFQIDSNLSLLLGSNELSEKELIYSLWKYIQVNNLQDKNDKRFINLNLELESIFNTKQLTFPDLLKRIRNYLKPIKPIRINYEIQTNKSTNLGETVLDLNIEIKESINKDFLKDKEFFLKNDSILKDLNNKLAINIQSINSSLTKYNFYKKFSENPLEFLKNWQKSHSESLKILLGDEGFNEENARRSEFYNDELLDENIDLLLNTNRI